MILILSPAKTLDYESPEIPEEHSQPLYLDEADKLIWELRQFDEPGLAALMKLSPKLAALNHQRFQTWQRPFRLGENARQALFTFKGDVYTGFNLSAYDRLDLAHAQHHLRILSGLYGILRPLDLIQPYRLEMGTLLKNVRGKNLYEFWSDLPAKHLQQVASESHSEILVNLASQEYYRAVDSSAHRLRVVTPLFKDEKNGKLKIIGFFAKKARGAMADFLLRQRVDCLEGIKDFQGLGYSFQADLSTASELVFTRPELTERE